MFSEDYKKLREAIEKKSCVRFTLHETPQIGSPHILGKGDNIPKVVIYRGEDSHKKDIPPTGEWSCIAVDDITNVMLCPDLPFHTGHPDAHQRKGISEVDISL